MRPFISLIIILAVNIPLAVAGQPQKISIIDQPAVTHQLNQVLSDTTKLYQPPNQVNGIFSDEGCDFCPSGKQVLAENFTVSGDGSKLLLEQIIIWGGYYPNDIPQALDDFDVLVHADSSGSPGTVICTETGITPASRTTTGVILFGVHEYQVTLDLVTPCRLSAGTYWLEIYNNSGLGTDDWFWETGDLDASNGIQGNAWATAAPGSTWIMQADNLAVQLVASRLFPWPMFMPAMKDNIKE
jgi:hypothetical protein